LRLADVVGTTSDRLGFADEEETEAVREETVEVTRVLEPARCASAALTDPLQRVGEP